MHRVICDGNRPNSQILQCTCPISQNSPFRAEMCAFLFWLVHCRIWDRCIVWFVRLVYCFELKVFSFSGKIVAHAVQRHLDQRIHPCRYTIMYQNWADSDLVLANVGALQICEIFISKAWIRAGLLRICRSVHDYWIRRSPVVPAVTVIGKLRVYHGWNELSISITTYDNVARIVVQQRAHPELKESISELESTQKLQDKPGLGFALRGADGITALQTQNMRACWGSPDQWKIIGRSLSSDRILARP